MEVVVDQLHVPAALFPGQESPYPLDRRLWVPQSWSRWREEEEILICWESSTGRPALA